MIEDNPQFQQAVRGLHAQIVQTIAPKVLIVDDDETDAFVLRHALLEEFPRMVVQWRQDTTTALAVVRAFPFDLVLLDLRLGLGLTGVDAFRQIRACSAVPVAGLTGLDPQSGIVQQALAAGLEAIFRKPLSQTAIKMLFGKCV